MNTVKHRLTVGTPMQGLDLYCNIKVDGKQKRRFRSKSFLGSFGSIIQSRMHGGGDLKLGLIDIPSSSVTSNEWIFDYAFEITGAQAQNPAQITINSTYVSDGFQNYDAENPTYIIVVGYGDFNGIYHGEKVSGDTFNLYDFDGNPVDGSGFSIPSATGYALPEVGWTSFHPHDRYDENNYQARFGENWEVVVGRSDKAIDVRDVYLHDRVMPGTNDGKLSHGTQSVSSQVTDKPTSKITLTKPFTNNGSTTIEVKELGVVTRVYDEGNDAIAVGAAIVRDVLGSPLSVPAGATLTVDYELVIRLSPDTLDTDTDGTNGGFLANFMGQLRQMCIGGAHERLQLATLPGTSYIGDENDHNDDGTASNTSGMGLKLGTVNKYVSMTDASLDPDNSGAGMIAHGEADGELYHYGTNIESFQYDTANNKATFEISRIFENRGSTTVTVAEMGLISMSNAFGSEAIQNNIELIARTALHPDDQFSIAPGDYKKVIYEVEVQA